MDSGPSATSAPSINRTAGPPVAALAARSSALVTYLAGVTDGRPVSSEELSASTNTNPVYVRRVLGPLRAAGLVSSRPGVHGGWELAVDARAIPLSQVWRSSKPPTRCSGCTVPIRRARSAAASRNR